MLRPPDYSHDFILYLVTFELTIGVFLVQEDDELQEHVFYYLSHALVGRELWYFHIEKLDLETMYVV